MSANPPPKPGDPLAEMLSAYLDGELHGDERAEIEQRLDDDPMARQRLAELEAAAGALRSLPRSAAPSHVMEGITTRLERLEVVGGGDETVTLTRHRRSPWQSALALAALIVVVLGASLYVSVQLARRGDGDLPPVATRGGAGTQFEESGGFADRSPPRRVPTDQASAPISTSKSAAAPVAQLADGDEASASADFRHREAEMRGNRRQPAGPTVNPLREGLESAGIAVEQDRSATKQRLAKRMLDVGRLDAGKLDAGKLDAGKLSQSPPPEVSENATLEFKLGHGAALDVVPRHDFDNEPLQIAMQFRSEQARNRLQRQLETLLTLDGAVDLDLQSTMTSPVQPTEPPARQRVFARGRRNQNFQPSGPTEQQMLLRLPAHAVSDLFELAQDNGADVALSMGDLTTQGLPQTQRWAATQLGVPYDGAAGRPEPLDLLALLERVGLAPPGLLSAPLPDPFSFGDDVSARRAGVALVGSDDESTPAEPPLLTVVLRMNVDPMPNMITPAGTQGLSGSVPHEPQPSGKPAVDDQ